MNKNNNNNNKNKKKKTGPKFQPTRASCMSK